MRYILPNRTPFFLVLILVAHFGVAQNLVPNPSFEIFTKCPVTYSTDPHQFGPTDWSSPSLGTPDYYNKCSISEMDVPRNWAGVSLPHTGVAYAGIYAWNLKGARTSAENSKRYNRSYREYIQCKLTEPMKAGVTYDIQFFYRLSSYSVYAIDRIGVALSNSELNVNYDSALGIRPFYTSIKNIETMTNAWLQAATKFKAKGGEQFLIIGNFSNNDSTRSMKIEYREGTSLMLGSSAYYYIDDVSVFSEEIITEEDQFFEAPKLNENYILKNIHFQFNSYELLSSSYTELDILISILKKNPKWTIQLSGYTDDQGTDEYNLELSRNRARSVGNYLIQKGVASNRIKTEGFGKLKPIRVSRDENARAINRRVEARFLD